MMSREDPYPIVNLEAAFLGKPLLCFANTGGSPEFIEKDAGFVVPYLNIDAMSNKAIALIKNEKLRKCFGDQARAKVLRRHTTSIDAPKILKLINKFI